MNQHQKPRIIGSTSTQNPRDIMAVQALSNAGMLYASAAEQISALRKTDKGTDALLNLGEQEYQARESAYKLFLEAAEIAEGVARKI
jgi:hypothetical protein